MTVTDEGFTHSYRGLSMVSADSQVSEKGPAGREIDLPEDIYGASMFSIIFDFYDIFGADHNADELSKSMNIMRLVFVSVVLITNFVLQGGMLFSIYSYVVLPSVHAVETTYQKYHVEVFDDNGKYNAEKWEAWDEGNKSNLCNIAFSNYWFMYAVLCLWCYAMMIEIRKTERLMRDLTAVDDCTHLKDMIDESDENIRIVKLTKGIDWLLFLVIIVPKLIIGLSLLLIGCVWLMATDSFSDLILNAVALEFVVNIDNILFEASMPVTIIEKMGATKFWVSQSKPSKQEEAKKLAASYYRSMFYFFGVFGLVGAMMSFGQLVPWVGVFPNYSHDAFCPVWWADMTKRVCVQGEECFPFGH